MHAPLAGSGQLAPRRARAAKAGPRAAATVGRATTITTLKKTT